MKKIASIFLHSLWLCIGGMLGLLSQLTYAAPDIVAQNYSASRSPGIQSCTVGYDLMAGDISYGQNLITGALPFSLNYKAPLRQNLSSAQVFAQPEESSLGWTDNYQAHVLIQNLSFTTKEYQNFSATQITSNPISYYLQTNTPVTTTVSAKEIIVRLPGESVDTIFKEQDGSFTRLYSADGFRDLNNYGMDQLPWNSDLGEYQLSRSGNNLIIIKNGVKYTITDTSYTMSPQQSNTSTINLYVDPYGYLRTTTSAWSSNGLYPIAISNTAPYIQTTATVSVDLYRVAKIEDQGRVLNLQYDSKMNLTQVSDQYNNKLVFEHTFHDTTLGTTQTIDESRLITKVTYTAAQGGTQVATFNYKAYANKVPSTGADTTVFALISSSSTIAGNFSYVNEMTEIGAVKAYVAFKGRTADSSYYYPVLRQVKNTSGQIVRQWDVTQNYVLNGTSYSTAQTTLRSYIPLSSGTAQDFTTVYDDNAKTINLTLQLANSTATSSIQSTVNADNSLTITASGYPCLTSNGTPVSSAEFKTDRSRLVKVTDANNVATSYEYDTQARITGITDADGTTLSRKTTYTYGLLNNNGVNLFLTPTSVVTPNLTITNVVNPRGQIVTQTQASSQTGSTSKVTTYAYDETTTSKHFGRLLSVDGPRSGTADKITYSYDVYGNLASQTQTVNGIARVTQYLGYNTFGEPERNLNPNGLVNQFIYNADGTLKSQTTGVGGATGTITGQTTTYTYNTLKQKISETNPDAEVTQFAYDLAGRLIQITLPNGNRIQKTYYSIGAVASEKSVTSAGSVATESYQYLDTKGRISKTQQGSDATRRYTTFIYDNNGNVIQTTTAAGVIEKWSYDVLNRVTSHTDGSGNIDTKGYDVNDNIVLSKDALNAGSNPFSYRNGNVLTQEVNTDYGTKSYSYNEADQLIQRLHGPRKCNYNTLDELGRYKAFVCAANSGTTASEYQVNNNYTYDQSRYGRLDKVTTGVTGYDVDTLYTYDAYDRVTQKGTTNQLFNRYAGTTGNTLNVNYGYSTGGKLTSMTLPSGRNVTYSYSTTGMLTGINLNGSALVRSISYDGANRVTGWQWGASGNAGYTQSYNNDGSIAALTNKDNASAVNYSLTFGYDKDGRITLVTRNNGTKDSYTYDAVNRLISESRTTGTAATYSISYTYDKNGNRLTLNATGQHMQPAASAAYTYTANTNKLASFTKGGVAQTFSHTTNSELSYGTYLPTYDYAGRRKVDRASTDYYFMNYNHKNERSFRDKVVNGAVATMTQYIYDEQSHLIGEYDKTGALVEYVWMGDKPVAAIYGSGAVTKIYYIITDAQNTPRRLVDGVTHAVVWSWDSTAFGVGNPTGSITFNLRFPGQYYDVGTNQFYNHNRFYNPELGRYMEPDPIGLEGGLNPYAYAGSNPVMNIDPSGLSLTRMDDFMMGNSIVNNLNNIDLNRAQLSFERMASNLINQVSNDNYLKSLSVKDTTQLSKYYHSTFYPNTTQIQQRAENLQAAGTAIDIFALGCASTVICLPVAGEIGAIGGAVGAYGTLLDQNASGPQKAISIAIPPLVSLGAVKFMTTIPEVKGFVIDAYGLYVDKVTGKTIDATYECVNSDWKQKGCK
ncbi:RHS repeat protein [Acinetobacter baumannii]|nr:RHS repeat protein [Acinetobacter baumannii]MDC5642254.1 RHS repeat protein [Acinetobacter baumannii]MDV7419202.1 RHS repeat-associated core domain-containing protein [Acinetobacter baumannii]